MIVQSGGAFLLLSFALVRTRSNLWQFHAKITFVSPGPEFPAGYTPKPSEPAPESPYSKMKVKDEEVVIKSGTLLNVELIKK